jgi:hypothetical protein
MAVVPAGVLALVLLLAAWRPWKPAPAGRGWWGSALALGLAIPLADRMVWHNGPGVWPVEPHRRLPLVALAAMAFGLAWPVWRRRTWRGYAVAGLAAACLAALMPVVFKAPIAPLNLLVFAILVAAAAMLFGESEAEAAHGARLPLVFCVAAAGAALVAIQSHSASQGLVTASMAAALAAFVAVAWWRPGLELMAAATPVYSILLVGVLADRSISLPATALTILSAATAGLASRGPLKGLPAWAGALGCVVVSVLLIAAALWFTPERFNFGETGSY